MDMNDHSKLFAIFYVSSTKHTTKTWLLFPDYSIAIEIDQHVLISWDGTLLRYCSCTGSADSKTTGSVYSMFAGAKKRHQWILQGATRIYQERPPQESTER